jgi:hypothetical protein
MSIFVIRAPMRPEAVAAVEESAHRFIAALDERKPEGFRFLAGRMADSATYLIMFEVEDGHENPLDTLPEYQEFVGGLKEWRADRSEQGPLELVGSYRIF